MTERELLWLRLHLTPGLGRAGILRLLESFGSPTAILAAERRDWTRLARIRPAVAAACPAADDPELLASTRELTRAGVGICALDDPDYPAPLRQIHDPPALLYRRGPWRQGECLAVVGARRASSAGQILTRQICRELAEAGITIVSGLARGIDTAAHLGALDAGGSTVAVLGCGIDLSYPPENATLLGRIAETGAIFSEYPPGTEPKAGHFPGRNRLISGLCAGVLVVEAAAGSGSLITVEFALDQGREIFAVPGAVHAATSCGVNQLLKQGATPVTEARDILENLFGRTAPAPPPGGRDLPPDLPPEQENLLKNLGFDPLHIDDLARKSALTPMEVSDILLHLELAGFVVKLPGARYLRSGTC